MSLARPASAALRAPIFGLRAGALRPLHTSRAAAIHASRVQKDATVSAQETGGFKYVPGGPVLKGTVNDATSFPAANKSHGSYHWAFERLVSAALLPMTGAAMISSATNHPILDGVLGLTLIIHSHIGFDSCIVDYLHSRKFPVLGPIATWALRAATVGAVYGVYMFNTQDIGLTELIARAWTV